MVDNSILRKVKACLARSKSSNPNEAAIALRQAHALMQKHSINVDSVEEMLNMVDISTTQKRRLPSYGYKLAGLVATYFECGYFFSSAKEGGKIVFYGENNAPTIASYAFEVLLRQLIETRKAYTIFDLRFVKIKANKTQRANAFARGWIDGVEKKLREFSSLTIPENKRKRLEEFAKQFDVQLATKVMSNNKVTTSDRLKGFEEGLEATLFHAATYNSAKNNIGGNSYYLGH